MSNNEYSFALEAELVDQLCQLLGIEGEYYDYKGEHHFISQETKAKLISALGFPIKSDAVAQKHIELLRKKDWQSTLPAVVVLREQHDKAVEICIPDQYIGATAEWNLQCEGGQSFKQSFCPQDQQYLSEYLIDQQRILRYRLYLPFEIPLGYHQLTIDFLDIDLPNANSQIIVAPEKSYQPTELHNKKIWGFGVQLYTLRSKRNWGIGDYTDLQELIRLSAESSASFIGLNPLHTLFAANPRHKSPYSPSSRLFLNYLYIDIEAVPHYKENTDIVAVVKGPSFQADLQALRDKEHVDYLAIAEKKISILRLLYDSFLKQHIKKNTEQAVNFKEFVQQGGEKLLQQSTYDALYEYFFTKSSKNTAWQNWPAEYQQSDTEAVKAFIKNNFKEVQFYQYLQWLSDQQLSAVQKLAMDKDMSIGLYRDMAVGVDGGGADVWSEPTVYSTNASVGAPADPLALQGQDWGLPPFNPLQLRETAYATFIALIQKNMQHCGALRIDHVMSLLRLWWIPEQQQATNGAYVYYPFEDLLGIIALESHRQKTMLIGEDLGTVPDKIREALPAANIYSYKVMYFEKQWNEKFKLPQDYVQQAMATISTHDLPTLIGWWEEVDIALRDKLALFPNEDIRQWFCDMRNHDRWDMLRALEEMNNLPVDIDRHSASLPAMNWALITAIHKQLAQSQAALMVVHLEDLLEMRDPVNVPGTVDEYPNWLRKLDLTTEALFSKPNVQSLLKEIDNARKQ